jgi:hypothetical protein
MNAAEGDELSGSANALRARETKRNQGICEIGKLSLANPSEVTGP